MVYLSFKFPTLITNLIIKEYSLSSNLYRKFMLVKDSKSVDLRKFMFAKSLQMPPKIANEKQILSFSDVYTG